MGDATTRLEEGDAFTNEQTRSEEILNSVTHGIGAALATAAMVLLVVLASLRGDAWRVVSLSVFGATLILLYTVSTLYHGFRNPRLKGFFHDMDHAAIYLLIAGTYTPVTLVPLRGPWGWTLFGLIWGMAICGILSRLIGRGIMRKISIVFYLAMGWLVVVAFSPMIRLMPTGLIVWLALGGLCYTVGVVFWALRRVPYNHVIWHLFVLAGSICHFFGMMFHVTSARG